LRAIAREASPAFMLVVFVDRLLKDMVAFPIWFVVGKKGHRKASRWVAATNKKSRRRGEHLRLHLRVR
jgi:hypothetical protein